MNDHELRPVLTEIRGWVKTIGILMMVAIGVGGCTGAVLVGIGATMIGG